MTRRVVAVVEGLLMPSVMGLLEAEEHAARQRVEVLREQADRLLAELNEAETDWQELVIAQQRVGRVLAGQHDAASGRQAVPDAVAPPADNATATSAAEAARPGTIPWWSPEADLGALAADYQRILSVLADARRHGPPPMTCKQIAERMRIELTPSKIEGVVRSRARRLADRGWAVQSEAGRFMLADGPAGVSSA
ncbi:hypothetical protein ACFYZB_43830 [Streptomyces sp. NPDC001852]|uniref:hypothetical protein n=1 Tax=Streptomyces sp. NPDC001852 TaxID=3364619 RepID=UPI0036C51056